MERIRKWMTGMAILGTVLTTGLFCYMPFREILKEYNRKTASLQQEESLGNVEDKAEALFDRMADSAKDAGPSEAGKQEGASGDVLSDREAEHPSVSFIIKNGDGELRTSVWHSGEGICYVFLPGFAGEWELGVDEIQDGGTVMIGSESFHEGDVIREIRWEEAYEFVLRDGEGEELLHAPLIFMQSSAIPVLALFTESESMEWIDEEKGNEEPGEMILWDEKGEICCRGNVGSIRGRGNSTWGLSKKPYQLNLEEKADLFGFGENRSWNLLADGYDETKLRNRLAFGLADALGMAYTPQGRTVDLYCNGVYYGVYYLCEKVEVGENRVAVRDMEEKSLAVYTPQQLEELSVITSEDGSRKWTDSQVEEADITGGYLFERELDFRYEEEISGFVTSWGDAYALKSPRYATEDQVNYIADRMQEFQDALAWEDGINRKRGKHYSEYIDVESFVQKYLVEEVTKNYDGGVTSSFFYKPEDAVSTRIFAGPVWDYDVIFGNCSLDGIVGDPMGITELNDHVLGTELFAMLCEKEDFYQRVTTLYEQKAAPYLDWLLEEGIRSMSREVEQAVRLDSIRWENLENRYQYYESYENNLRALEYYIEARKKFLDDVWLSGVSYHTVTFVVDGEAWKRIYIEDGQTAGHEPVPVKYNSLFAGWFSESHDVPYDEYKPVYEDMSFYAVWQELPPPEDE
ncbi:MAG: hypothetical protein HFI47_10250 [Lachnospiraceae bacterium]|nr:hypothetical protein [Lachnospiraceae bacterium]